MIRKFFVILLKSLFGLLLFYFFCAFALIPLLSPWVIKRQGESILKVPVAVRGVYFNPFYLSLHIVGLEIKNQSLDKIVGFDRLIVDVSFKDLFKKVIHFESIELDGLFVHATLLENGAIDLQGLIPASSSKSTKELSAEPASVQHPPIILIDQIIIRNGRVQFVDRMIQPVFRTSLSQMEGIISNLSTEPDHQTKIDLSALWDEKGKVTAQIQLKPFQTPLDMELHLGLDQYALTALSPYVGKYTGRHLSGGKLDFKTTYWVNSNKLKATHTIVIQHFNFGSKVDSPDALKLPFGLAIALLEDSQQQIKISLPVAGDLRDPQFKYQPLIWQTVRNFFMKLISQPFSILGSILGGDGGSDQLGSVRFLPGSSELSPEEVTKLMILAKAMIDRQRLLLQIHGSYDLTSDWKQIKTSQFNKDYALLRKESTKDESWVLQTLYQRRFGLRQLWKLTKQFKTKEGYDFAKLNPEIKRHLSEDAFPDKAALNELAQARAQTIYDMLLSEHVDPRRVTMGINHSVQGSMGFVLLEFVLTVFEENEPSVAAEAVGVGSR